jgi:hypothetical protein
MERANLNLSQWLWWVERDSVLLAYYNASSDEFTSPSEAGKVVTLLYIQRPDKFLVTGESPARDGFDGTDGTKNDYLGTDTLDTDTKMKADKMLEQECEIPEQFHETLIARVIAQGYERKPETLPLAAHFMGKYEKGLREAKTYSIRGRDGSMIQAKPMDF